MEQNLGSPESLFGADAAKDTLKAIETEAATNEYIAHLKSLLPAIGTPEGRRAAADYGVSQVSEDEDPKLGTYFFVISNLNGLPAAARDFFMDVMIYCEDRMGELKSVAVVKAKYEKEIRPLL